MITGDLVDFGAVEEYQTLQLLLRRLQLPFRLMPGNHDDRQAQREVFADHVYLQQGVTLNWQLKVGPLQQLALEFSVPEQPWGEIDAHQLRWLEQHLACEPAAPTLVMLQYIFRC
ncbi:metallophosphoesterase [Pantoea tagorei]